MAGGMTPAIDGAINRLGLSRVLSFRSGLLIAAACTDVLPQAWRLSPAPAALAALGALALGWHLHGGGGDEDHTGHEHTHPHIHPGQRTHLPTAVAGLFLHSMVDGLNLGAVALVSGPALLAVGAATVLHKTADGFALTTLFRQSRHPHGRAFALLIAISLATPIGAALGQAGVLSLGASWSAVLLGYAGGSFLYVGSAQIFPGLGRPRFGESALSFGAGLAAPMLLRGLSS
jgi:zinc transporter ZupT